MKKNLIMAVGIALFASGACAAENGAYVYAGLGYTKADTDVQQGINEFSAYAVPGTFSSHLDDNDVGMKLAAGYRFNDYFALEGSYSYLGKTKFGFSGVEGVSGYGLSVAAEASMTAHVMAVDAVGIYPVNDQFEVFAKAGLGLSYVSTEMGAIVLDNRYVGAANDSDSDVRVFPKIGVGVEWQLDSQWAIRAEYERLFDVSKETEGSFEADYDMFSVGVKYCF